VTTCIHCGTAEGLSGKQQYCSSNCRWEAYKLRHPDALAKCAARTHRRYAEGKAYQRDLSPRPCRSCKQTFTPQPGDGRRVFCSVVCYKKDNKRQNRHSKPGSQMFRARARKYGVAYEPGITWHTVMVRFGSQCALCGDLVMVMCSRTDPLSPTVDHKAPMTQGGGHVWTNVQLAHRICNSHKRDLPCGQKPYLHSETVRVELASPSTFPRQPESQDAQAHAEGAYS
jgi:hypothetical protein